MRLLKNITFCSKPAVDVEICRNLLCQESFRDVLAPTPRIGYKISYICLCDTEIYPTRVIKIVTFSLKLESHPFSTLVG